MGTGCLGFAVQQIGWSLKPQRRVACAQHPPHHISDTFFAEWRDGILEKARVRGYFPVRLLHPCLETCTISIMVLITCLRMELYIQKDPGNMD